MRRRRRSIATTVAVSCMLAVAVATTTAAAAGEATGARCLRGAWRTTNVEANALLQRLVPLPEAKVSRGVLTAAFGGGEMRYGSTSFQVAITTSTLVMRASASFVYETRYAATSGRISFRRGTSELAISKFKATKDGKTFSAPGPAPTTTSIPAGSVLYTCRGNTLSLRPPVGAPRGAFVTFSRVP